MAITSTAHRKIENGKLVGANETHQPGEPRGIRFEPKT